MPDFYVPVTDAEGNVTYQPASEEVIAEAVKEHPLHKATVQEAIDRRLKLKEQREAAAATPAAPALDEDALLAKLMQRVTGELSAKQTAEQQRQAAIEALIAKHNLSKIADQARSALVRSSDPEATASALADAVAALTVRFDDAKPSNPMPSADDPFFAKVLANMGLK